LFTAFFLYLADSKYHVNSPTVTFEAVLALGDDVVKEMVVDVVQDNSGHNLPCDTEE
jgi:hypothetical protein